MRMRLRRSSTMPAPVRGTSALPVLPSRLPLTCCTGWRAAVLLACVRDSDACQAHASQNLIQGSSIMPEVIAKMTHLSILRGLQMPVQGLCEHLALGRKVLHLKPVGVAVLPDGILRI